MHATYARVLWHGDKHSNLRCSVKKWRFLPNVPQSNALIRNSPKSFFHLQQRGIEWLPRQRAACAVQNWRAAHLQPVSQVDAIRKVVLRNDYLELYAASTSDGRRRKECAARFNLLPVKSVRSILRADCPRREKTFCPPPPPIVSLPLINKR
jgi:hypothetical protein